jgi:photosystem II stability/assembly factor-like uncharacterized protein
MGSSDVVYNSLDSGLFVQPGGPGTTMRFLGCHDADDIEAPKGSIEISQTFRPDRSGWDIVSSRKGPPELVTTTVTGLSKATRDYLEKYLCQNGALYVMFNKCAPIDNPMNYARAFVMHHMNVASETYANTHMREESSESSGAFELEFWPPLLKIAAVTPGRVTITEAQALNDIWTDPYAQCQGDCGSALNAGDVAGVACDAAGGATPDVLFSTNGLTFALGAVDPAFGVGNHAMAITAFPINKAGRRWVVGQAFPAGAQGHVAYSDDAGASWTLVNIGGAAAGHGAVMGGALFSMTKEFIHLASAAGYIYKSIDGGATWTAKEAGVIAAGNYSAVHFFDDKLGCAVGAAGVVALSINGGESWSAGGVIGAGAAVLNCVRVLDTKRIMVGDAAGKLWQSIDFGATWTQITGWTGSGVGQVRGIDAAPGSNGYVVWMTVQTAGPVGSVLRSIDGGANFVLLNDPALPTNSGVNAIRAISENSAYVVGEANGGTGFLAKITEA